MNSVVPGDAVTMSTAHHTASPLHVTPACLTPTSLTTLAARAVARCLTYEDYDDCCHYRWDPVNIWQYEIPQKKKKGKKSTERSQMYSINEAMAHAPKPAWQDIRKFRDWWWDMSSLGSMESVIRSRILTAFEQLSWTVHTEEESILFLLLRICIETKIKLEDVPVQIESSWCGDIAQILSKLGPFPLLKLHVSHYSLELKPLLISLVQQLPCLQVLHVNHWALSNDFMAALGTHCRMLTEFCILSMNPQVFMSDEALFTCFFDGTSSKEVVRRMNEGGDPPPRSFPRLRLLDLFYWNQTERFIKVLAYFYPKVKLRDLDFGLFDDMESEYVYTNFKSQVEQVPRFESKVPVPNRCATFNIFKVPWDRLTELARHSRHLTALRVIIQEREAEGLKVDLGGSLRNVVELMNDFETLTVRYNANTSLIDILAPSLSAKGECLTSLYLYLESEAFNVRDLYKVLNGCPRLCVLVLAHEKVSDNLFADSKVKLHPCHTLHTLGIITSAFPFNELSHLLEYAHNLKCLGLSCPAEAFTESLQDSLPNLPSLHCDTLRSLHLQFTSSLICSDLLAALKPLLVRFPSLRSLSLNQKYDLIPFPAIYSLLHTGLEVTQWPAEFLSSSQIEESDGDFYSDIVVLD